jgi:hypothetical protein
VELLRFSSLAVVCLSQFYPGSNGYVLWRAVLTHRLLVQGLYGDGPAVHMAPTFSLAKSIRDNTKPKTHQQN